jgi:hypothetical protein
MRQRPDLFYITKSQTVSDGRVPCDAAKTQHCSSELAYAFKAARYVNL